MPKWLRQAIRPTERLGPCKEGEEYSSDAYRRRHDIQVTRTEEILSYPGRRGRGRRRTGFQ